MLKHSLYDSASILMYTHLIYSTFECIYNKLYFLALNLFNNLLYHMIAIRIFNTIIYLRLYLCN